jgi:hypothetical protein
MANDPKALADVLKPDNTYPDGSVDWGKDASGNAVHYSKALYDKLVANQTKLGGSDVQLGVLKEFKGGHIPDSDEIKSPSGGMTYQQWRTNCVEQPDGSLKNGSVTVSKELVGFMDRIGNRQPPDPELAAMLEKASFDRREHPITSTPANDSRAPGGGVIVDPDHGFKDYHNEANVSSERVFKHELGHALVEPAKQQVMLNIPDAKGLDDNIEEKRARTIETRGALANQLGRTSHHANPGSDVTLTDPNRAPQSSERPELLVHRGADGKGALQGKGAVVEGEIDSITYKDGFKTINFKGGHTPPVSFPQTTHTVAGDPGQKYPVNSATEDFQANDKIKLTIPRDGESVSVQNYTQGSEVKVTRNGDRTAVNKDFSQDLTPTH